MILNPNGGRNASARFDNDKRRRPEQHPNQRRLTPRYILDPIRSAFGRIDLDPCTEPDNPTGAVKYYTPPCDGAAEPWHGFVFCNPPYGEARSRWIEKSISESRHKSRVVLLVPASTDVLATQRALVSCTTVMFLRGRLKYGIPRSNGRQEAASHPSALFGFNVDLGPLAKWDLGVVLAPKRETVQYQEILCLRTENAK